MIILNYKNELYRFFIYICALFVALFIITNVLIKEPKNEDIKDVTTSLIETNEENLKIYVEYPRFKNDDITKIVTDYIYTYVKDFKSNEKEKKILDVSYSLYYFSDYLNIVFNIENSLSNVKNKNILINLKKKELDYITNIYDNEHFTKEIHELVENKYSTDIYNKIKKTSINNFTYVIDENKIVVYFNNIDFKVDYIPYIEINLTEEVENVSTNSTKQKYIAFTYDDGPSQYTNSLLKTLELNNSSATFFMIGNRLNKYKDTVKAVYNSNSEIGSHSYAHKDLRTLSKKELEQDLEKTNEIFNSITEDNLKYLRPPYNYYNDNVKNTNYTIITWNIDPKDWLVKDSQTVYNSVIKHACDGCIVLMHDIYKETLEATKMLIPKLNEMGYEVVSVSELMKIKNYTPQKNKIITSIK